jgi:ATP-dependent Lon protease
MFLDDVEDSRDIVIPKNPVERVIGQAKAVEKVKIAVKQRRHLLLVGPPGIGKSMLAQAFALSLPRPNQEIRLSHNDLDPDRPILEVVSREEINKELASVQKPHGNFVSPMDIPYHVAVQLGFRCSSCSAISSDRDMVCPNCGINKYASRSLTELSPFTDIMNELVDTSYVRPEREVTVIERGRMTTYRKVEGGKIQVIDADATQHAPKRQEKRKKILVPMNRIPFVQATGASETELLGDVRHDPYGSHPEIGTPAYTRVVPGAVHEAHEGVLFIDELPHIQHLQSYILTAMQEKRFPIIGRNPHSSGASVKVADVPCDFVFVGACNIVDLDKILPPLRSRILGGGYEILLDTTMPDTEDNRAKLAQFVAQEIETDAKIPPANREAIEEIIKEAKNRAIIIDNSRNALTLRLRDLGGLLRYAGDLAKTEDLKLIEAKHIRKALIEAKPVEQQIKESYGSIWGGIDRGDRGSGGLGSDGNDKLYR